MPSANMALEIVLSSESPIACCTSIIDPIALEWLGAEMSFAMGTQVVRTRKCFSTLVASVTVPGTTVISRSMDAIGFFCCNSTTTPFVSLRIGQGSLVSNR